MRSPLKVAIIGSRGYPYVYSGYETLVKALAERFTQQGVDVTVYCHAHLFEAKPKEINGVKLVYIPTISSKALSQPVHSFLSFWHVSFSKADVVLVLNVSNGPFGMITRLFRKPTLMNVDGMEWLRPKWKGFGATYFKWAAKQAVKYMDRLVTDADSMQAIYQKEFNASSVVITYGAEASADASADKLSPWGLNPRDYYLIIGRMIPDNNADWLLNAFIQTNSTKKLVIVGDVPYKDKFASALKATKDLRVIFTGYVRDAACLSALYKYCYVYLHGHEFGGTNPTLLKAMANGCAIGALDTVFSREVLQEEQLGYYFQKNILSIKAFFEWADAHPDALEQRRTQIKQGITPKYTWDIVTDLYLYHLKNLVQQKVDKTQHDKKA